MKINKIFNGLWFTILAATIMTGCYEDKGNYDYEDLHTTYIQGISETYYRIMGEDTLTIRPTLWDVTWDRSVGHSVKADPDDYTFEWLLIGGKVKGIPYNQYVISTEPQLDSHSLGMAEGVHTFCLKVTDKRGVSFFSEEFFVRVESQLGRGLVIMSEVDNATRLDYLNYFNKKVTLIPDIMGKIGSEAPLSGAPVSVSCFWDTHSPLPNTGADGYAVMIMTETDGFYLKAEDFTFEPEYDLYTRFINKPEGDFKPVKVIVPQSDDTAWNSAMMYDAGTGKLYFYYGAGNVTHWSNENYLYKSMMPMPTGGIIKPSQHSILYQAGGMALLFDENKKSFYYSMQMMAWMMMGAYDLDLKVQNLGKDLVFLQEIYLTLPVVAILKDPATGAYTLLRFSAQSGADAVFYDLTLPDAENIVEFGAMWTTGTSPYIYYRTDEKIYALNMADRTVHQVYSTSSATSKGGPKISKMKFVRNGSSSTEPVWRDNLLVFTYDPALPEESCGTLEMYKSKSGSGDLEFVTFENQSMLFTGLGKVADADFKQK